MRKLFCVALLALNTPVFAADIQGSIAGAADAGAQILVTSLSDGQVIGIMAKCDGTYRAEELKPGRYKIVVNGPNHAAREVGVSAGKESQVDLAPPRGLASAPLLRFKKPITVCENRLGVKIGSA